MTNDSMKWLARCAVDSRIWRPANAQLIWHHLIYRNRNRDSGFTDRDHLLASAAWLERAQDATGTGGVAGRYLLDKGWTSAYPETTGYIIPTFIALSREFGSSRFVDRAKQAVDFLLSLQFADGSFPGGEIHENTTQPSTFNTAQILGGLIAWYVFSGDDSVLKVACRAADWLVSTQDPDGAWRGHTYNNVPVTYSSHGSCWLAELSKHTGESSYLEAARKHFDWVLEHQDQESGWFDLSGFSREDHEARRALTHTIAYTLWGLLITAEILDRPEGVSAVQKAAEGMARRLEMSQSLPGVLDNRWRSQATYTCLTGNLQMALVWLRLDSVRRDGRFLNAALKAIDYVKAAQPMSNLSPGILGGIPGSYPVWGGYIYMGLPNWAAKFFIDALIAKKAVLSEIPGRPFRDRQVVPNVPESLPKVSEQRSLEFCKVIMYSTPESHKVQQMVTAWSAWNFKPDVVVIERKPEPGLMSRLIKRVQDDGFGWILSRYFRKEANVNKQSSSHDPEGPNLLRFCSDRGIPVIEVGRLDSAEAVEAVRALKPDVAIHAGAGIMRAPLLGIPRIGTLNAHMGVLPYYRGMNVAEWSFFDGGVVGGTVHLIDPGIDSGDILCVRRVETCGVRDIRDLRARVDAAQISLLGEVVRFILNTGELPPRRMQTLEEGRQFFRMHPELASILEARLKEITQSTA